MYIRKIQLTNIRSLRELEITFPENPAGWHVLLGENGAGKSSVIRAVSAALLGPSEVLRLDPDFGSWVKSGEKRATIDLEVERHLEFDKRPMTNGSPSSKSIRALCKTEILLSETQDSLWVFRDAFTKKDGIDRTVGKYYWEADTGWFSAAFGPYRRFAGGNYSLESFYKKNPRIGAHLTAFNEDAALTETVVWLKDLQLRNFSAQIHLFHSQEEKVLEGIRHFINQNDLLPPGFSFRDITPDGPFFNTPNGSVVHLYELSEGIKSVTSLAFELMRLLLHFYGAETVFKNFFDDDPDNNFIPVPGVVLIDEIDVHLHPTWQARIGHWFTRCFPAMQFIVTTHSPIICRAAVNGSVWWLPAPGSDDEPRQITGSALDRLLYGDILDAYGTNIFGTDVTRDEQGHEKLARLAELNMRFYRDEATPAEKKEREQLIKIFPTDDSIFP